jgi:methoxymalonate biosynthesis acyl carrier protein
MNTHHTTIRNFLERFIDCSQLTDDQNFFAAGFINSLFAMQIVLFVERQFGIKVANTDLDVQNFSSINAIAGLVARKSAA